MTRVRRSVGWSESDGRTGPGGDTQHVGLSCPPAVHPNRLWWCTYKVQERENGDGIEEEPWWRGYGASGDDKDAGVDGAGEGAGVGKEPVTEDQPVEGKDGPISSPEEKLELTPEGNASCPSHFLAC